MPHTHTFLKDFGRALVILGEHSEADGQAWHVPNDMPRITQRDMIKMFAEEAGVPAKISSMSKLAMKMVGLFIPEVKEMVEMLYEFDQPFIMDSSKFERTFGMKATPMRDAIRETVAWFKSHPERK
jgi:nucleoside-diphosphate-sugar epimerase